MNLEELGKIVVGCGIALLVVGGLFLLLGRFEPDRLPGDLTFRRGDLTVYFPVGLMVLVSIIGTVVLNIVPRR